MNAVIEEQRPADMEARLIEWYWREHSAAHNERMPQHWQRQAMGVCEDISKVLGYTPEKKEVRG